MQLKKVLELINEHKPNKYSDKDKIRWINEIEHTVMDEVLHRYEAYKHMEFVPYTEADMDKDVLVPDEYCDVYFFYVASKMDALRGESDRYNNATVLFNGMWDSYASWMMRHNAPVSLGQVRKW